MKRKYVKSTAIALAAIFTTCSMASCGGSGSKSSADNLYYSYDAAAAPAQAAVAYETEAAMAMEAAPYYEDGAYNGSEDTGSTTSSQPQTVPDTSRKLIRTVHLNVETTDFDNLLSSIQQSVAAQGGYIQQSDISGTSISYSSDRRRYAYLTVRIPSEKLDGFLSQMGQQSNIINRSENIQDITLQYTDIQSRKKSLTIEQERLWALLEKADTLEAVIALEERLSEIRYELECFESQLRTYDNQVDYSTVTIDISEVTVFTPTAPDSVATRIQKGFIRNLENVGQSITDFIVWFISHLPALVVLFVIIGAVLFFVRLLPHPKKKDRSPKKIFFKKSAKQAEQSSTDEKQDQQ